MKFTGIFLAGLLLSCFCSAQDGLVFQLDLERTSEGISRGPYENLQIVKSPPQSGTFWSLQLTNLPPYPANPFPELPVYSFGDAFIFDDWDVDWVAIKEQGFPLFGFADTGSKSGGIQMMADGPPAPGGGGGGTNEGWPTNSFPPAYDYSTNDLWLEITGKTNDAGYFVVHTPDTNAFDLFTTTNLSPNVSGLNLTNWLWLLRSAAPATNIIITNLWATEGWFILGTMQNSDSDGLTDAFEKLVTHTLPNNSDSDGDGVDDYEEWLIGRNPLGSGANPDTNGTVRLRIHTRLK
jgi:hypothetical protein